MQVAVAHDAAQIQRVGARAAIDGVVARAGVNRVVAVAAVNAVVSRTSVECVVAFAAEQGVVAFAAVQAVVAFAAVQAVAAAASAQGVAATAAAEGVVAAAAREAVATAGAADVDGQAAAAAFFATRASDDAFNVGEGGGVEQLAFWAAHFHPTGSFASWHHTDVAVAHDTAQIQRVGARAAIDGVVARAGVNRVVAVAAVNAVVSRTSVECVVAFAAEQGVVAFAAVQAVVAFAAVQAVAAAASAQGVAATAAAEGVVAAAAREAVATAGAADVDGQAAAAAFFATRASDDAFNVGEGGGVEQLAFWAAHFHPTGSFASWHHTDVAVAHDTAQIQRVGARAAIDGVVARAGVNRVVAVAAVNAVVSRTSVECVVAFAAEQGVVAFAAVQAVVAFAAVQAVAAAASAQGVAATAAAEGVVAAAAREAVATAGAADVDGQAAAAAFFATRASDDAFNVGEGGGVEQLAFWAAHFHPTGSFASWHHTDVAVAHDTAQIQRVGARAAIDGVVARAGVNRVVAVAAVNAVVSRTSVECVVAFAAEQGVVAFAAVQAVVAFAAVQAVAAAASAQGVAATAAAEGVVAAAAREAVATAGAADVDGQAAAAAAAATPTFFVAGDDAFDVAEGGGVEQLTLCAAHFHPARSRPGVHHADLPLAQDAAQVQGIGARAPIDGVVARAGVDGVVAVSAVHAVVACGAGQCVVTAAALGIGLVGQALQLGHAVDAAAAARALRQALIKALQVVGINASHAQQAQVLQARHTAKPTPLHHRLGRLRQTLQLLHAVDLSTRQSFDGAVEQSKLRLAPRALHPNLLELLRRQTQRAGAGADAVGRRINAVPHRLALGLAVVEHQPNLLGKHVGVDLRGTRSCHQFVHGGLPALGALHRLGEHVHRRLGRQPFGALQPRDRRQRAPIGVGQRVGLGVCADHRLHRALGQTARLQAKHLGHPAVDRLQIAGHVAAGPLRHAQHGRGLALIATGHAQLAHRQLGQGVDVDHITPRPIDPAQRAQIGAQVQRLRQRFVQIVFVGLAVVDVVDLEQHRTAVGGVAAKVVAALGVNHR